MSRPQVETATSRVERLLTMVPWLVGRQGIEISRAAEGLGITEDQLKKDLDLLFMCGYGPMTDELIEVSYEGGRVFVSNADTIARPLRLSVDEAISLIVGLRSLSALEAGESSAVERALAKLEEVAGAIPGVERVMVVDDDTEAGRTRSVLQDALSAGRRVHLTYHVPSRDERTERDVDPMRLARVEGHWYLEGWCHRAQDVRLFRTDRIEAVEVLDVPSEPPADAVRRDLSAGAYQRGEGDLPVTLRLAPSAHWVAEYYPVTSRETSGEDLVVTLPTSNEGFLRRLVLRLGGAAEVVEPEALRTAVTAHATQALAAYDPA
ncbi:WYL domain-containing protein [Janibacter sp. CX7]|jgi:proteasome accessory factor C|uniref:helix-turn-helix transcriptional regulator n=1 Tax=unclassified Janibacter TaxID=2649294 RepID=UPI0020CBBAEF|nr:WYL domain-containing protein [Janibacter sp. CX7]UTT64688.1 WYL domain-containing protein [Janibacter sp. CX7]